MPPNSGKKALIELLHAGNDICVMEACESRTGQRQRDQRLTQRGIIPVAGLKRTPCHFGMGKRSQRCPDCNDGIASSNHW